MTAILGGGISGLSAAYYLLKSTKHQVTVIEGSKELGGWIRSIKYLDQQFIFEKGPRMIRPGDLKGKNTLSLLEELNLSDKISPVLRSHPSARNRLIYAKSKLSILPTSLFSIFKTCAPFTRPLIFSAFNDLRAPKTTESDESIYSFSERRFGKEVADYLVSSMICGICAGDAKKISVHFLMSQLFEYEQKHGSVIKGFFKNAVEKSGLDSKLLLEISKSPLIKRSYNEGWSLYTLNGGLQTLPETLGRVIQDKGVKIKFDSLCSKLSFDGNNKVICVIDDQNGLTLNGVFDHVICSLPAPTLAKLVSDQHPDLSKELEEIKHVTVAVVNISYKGKHLKYDGFGFLAPPVEELPILGVIFDSCNSGYKDWTVLTVMMGGHWYDKYFGADSSEDEILDIALRHVSNILDINASPEFTHVSILKDCIPQYTVGHKDRVSRITSYIKERKLPLSLIGSSYHGVGINDVIYSAKNCVHSLIK